MVLSKGTIISERYKVEEVLGKGGMAIAYKAKDLKLDRDVTVKVLRDDYIEDQDFIEKFKKEARSVASLAHPNLVSVYDVGNDENIYYIVMEYVHGDDLKRTIETRAPFDSKTVLSIAIQISTALIAAHNQNIVHRDIKPQNILISYNGTIKVTDFGVARAISDATMATAVNAVGSVHYFSPEQARGGYVDEKSDIYSLGITMYEMVTGKLPYDGDSSVSVALKHLKDQLPDMRQFNPNISPAVEGIIKKATRKNPDERYQSVEILLDDLRKALKECSGIDTSTMEPKAVVPPKVVKAEQEVDIPEFKNRQDALSSLTIEDVPRKDIKYSKRQLKEIEKRKNMRISKEDDYEEDYVPAKKRNVDYEDGYDKDKEKKVIIVAILTSLIIIALISIAGIKFLKGGTSSGNIKVPTFAGITVEQAEQIAEGLGITVAVVDEQASDVYDAGIVIEQAIAEGSKVDKGVEIGLVVSSGASTKTMINVVGEKEREATSAIKKVTNASIKIEYISDSKQELGVVISQNPAKGASITDDSIITLVVNESEVKTLVEVPNLVGKTEAEAKTALEKAGLKLGSVTKVESDTVKEGAVVSQTVFAGDQVDENTSVSISVSKGGSNSETPSTGTGDGDNTDDTSQNTPSSTPSNTPKTIAVTIQPTSIDQTADVVRVELIKVGSSGQMETVINEARNATDFPYYVNVTDKGVVELQLYVDGVLQWSKNVNFSEGGN